MGHGMTAPYTARPYTIPLDVERRCSTSCKCAGISRKPHLANRTPPQGLSGL